MVDASLVNVHSFERKENECSVGFKGKTAEERCTALLNDSVGPNGTSLVYLGSATGTKNFLSQAEEPNDDCKDGDCKCADLKKRVKELEDRVKRCESDTTCWPRAKKMLPVVIEKLNAHIEKHCKEEEKKEEK